MFNPCSTHVHPCSSFWESWSILARPLFAVVQTHVRPMFDPCWPMFGLFGFWVKSLRDPLLGDQTHVQPMFDPCWPMFRKVGIMGNLDIQAIETLRSQPLQQSVARRHSLERALLAEPPCCLRSVVRSDRLGCSMKMRAAAAAAPRLR